jgi:hypothetical protein
MALEFDRDRKRRILGVVQELLCRAVGERREGAELIHEPVGRHLQLGIRYTFGCNAPCSAGTHHRGACVACLSSPISK